MYSRRFRLAIPLTVLALVSLSQTLRADEAIQLRYKGQVGDKTIYQSALEQLTSQTVMGQELETKFKQTDVTLYTTKAVEEDGGLKFESENKTLKVEGDFGVQGNYVFDSSADDNDSSSLIGGAVTPLFERMSGAILQLELSPLGKVKKVTGYKELVADILKGNPIASQFAGGGSDEAALTGFQDSFVIFKEEAVKPGDSWEIPYEIKLPQVGKLKGKRTYTFVGSDTVGKIPTLKIKIDLDLSGKLDIDSDEAKISGEIEVDSYSGTVQFDPKAGVILTMETEQTLSGDLSVEAGGQTIPVGLEQTIKTKRTKLDKLPE